MPDTSQRCLSDIIQNRCPNPAVAVINSFHRNGNQKRRNIYACLECLIEMVADDVEANCSIEINQGARSDGR